MVGIVQFILKANLFLLYLILNAIYNHSGENMDIKDSEELVSAACGLLHRGLWYFKLYIRDHSVKVRSIMVHGIMHRKPLQFSAVKVALAPTGIIYEQKERLRNLRGSL